jgi:hypothetical protein
MQSHEPEDSGSHPQHTQIQWLQFWMFTLQICSPN